MAAGGLMMAQYVAIGTMAPTYTQRHLVVAALVASYLERVSNEGISCSAGVRRADFCSLFGIAGIYTHHHLRNPVARRGNTFAYRRGPCADTYSSTHAYLTANTIARTSHSKTDERSAADVRGGAGHHGHVCL